MSSAAAATASAATPPALGSFFERFAHEQRLPGAAWDGELLEERRRALEQLRAQGFPSTKHEAWRYTSLAQLAQRRFASALPGRPDGVDLSRLVGAPVTQVPSHRLVYVGGRFARELSNAFRMPDSVRVRHISAASERRLPDRRFARIARSEGRPFVALNTALFAELTLIEIAPGAELRRPIHLVHLNRGSGVSTHPRVLLLMGRGAKATLVESFRNSEGQSYLTNAVTELALGRGARLEHVRLQREAQDAYHVGHVSALLGRDARYRSHVVSFGSELVRHEVEVALREPGAAVYLGGLDLGSASEHLDAQTVIDHQAPRCTSRELYKAVLDGRASGVFNGRVLVRQGADGSDAQQQSRNLLLSQTAVANTKPQLEIFADDVKCAHGATVSQLDDEALHYLRARGIGEPEARQLLTLAFADEVLAAIDDAGLRAALRAEVRGEAIAEFEGERA